MNEIALFSLGAGRGFAARVAHHLGLELSAHEERDFEDGEHKIRPLCNVRDRDVYVMQSLYSDSHSSVDAKLVRLLFFLGALRDAGAARVNAVVPYLCYARKDRRTKPRDPLSIRYLAQLFEAVGADRMMTLDVHNLAAYQNAFRCRTEHLSLQNLLLDYFMRLFIDLFFEWPALDSEKNTADIERPGYARIAAEITVASPDVGGIKRADLFREALGHRLGGEVAGAFMEKRRSLGQVSGDQVVGEVRGRNVIIIDDLVAGGTTLARAAEAFLRQGAKRVYAAVTHGVFAPGAGDVLSHSALTQLIVSNSLPPVQSVTEALGDRLAVLDVTGLLAEAIDRINSGGSLVELLEWDQGPITPPDFK